MKSKMILILLILILFAGSAFAADLVSIDMPNEADNLQAFTLKLSINDPNVIEYANKVVIEKAYGVDFFITRRGASGDDSHAFEFKYNGEKEIIFDVIPTATGNTLQDSIGSFKFTFYGDAAEIKAKFPQANIYTYQGDIGVVERKITVNPVSFNVNLPKVPGNIIKNDEDWAHVGNVALTFTYADSKNDLRSYHGTFTKSVCPEPWPGKKYCANVDFFSSTNTKHYTGEFSYKGLKGEYYAQSYRSYYDEAQGIEYLAIEVRFIAKNGFLEYLMQIQNSRKIKISDEENYVKETIAEMTAMAESATYTKIKSLGGSYASTYAPRIAAEAPIKKEIKIFGTVANAENNPMPFMEIEVTADGKKFTVYTSKTGDFSIPLTGLDAAKEIDAQVRLNMEYVRDKKNYFLIYFRFSEDDYRSGTVEDNIKIKPDADVELHYVYDDSGLLGKATFPSVADIKALSVIYYHMHEAVDFAITKLNANIDYKLPVEIAVGNLNGKTQYRTSSSLIDISAKHMDIASTFRPMNREYHEFGHHVMFAEYGAWPDGDKDPASANHAGFINPNTADSYIEGFAEFYSMLVAENTGRKNPEIYSVFGSLENNYKAWQSKGRQEEFAIAGILWDLYDSKNDKGDTISISLDEIWSVLKVKRANFFEYYKAFIDKYPLRADAINQIFIEHGFFADKSVGNSKRDIFEPFLDKNGNKAYDNGEYYIDYGCQIDENEISFKKGGVIGKAANYQRADARSQAGLIPDAFLKAANSAVSQYRINVLTGSTAYSYVADVWEGLLYVHPLPDDLDGTITITPESQDYKAGQEFKISNKELVKKINEAKDGYFADFDFNLKPTGSSLDKNPVYKKGFEPTYAYEGDLDENAVTHKFSEYTFGGKTAVTNPDGLPVKKSGSSFGIIIALVIIALCVAGYFMKDKIGQIVQGQKHDDAITTEHAKKHNPEKKK